jgi:hypothetical protein
METRVRPISTVDEGKLNPGFGAASSADFKAYKMLIDLHLFS